MVCKQQIATAVRRALVMSAVAATGAAAPAFAQESLDEIIVTGSRIRAANLESTTPVTQVTAADVVTQGVSRIEDLVNQLPQAFAAQNVTVANGATGTATLNLRGLGSPRTLVLIDGRRMPYGGASSASAAPDINQIPTQMIERVDILTGGASAVYGSDAVAGVVNFIMKKDFEGVQVTSQYNFYWHENDYGGPGTVKLRDEIANRAATNPAEFALPDDTVTDGEGKELSLMVGVNSGDGRGNITAYATVFDSDQVLQRDRDYSACSIDTTKAPTEQFFCGGSSASAGGSFTDFSTYAFTVDTATSFRNFDSSTDLYNFGPLNHYQRPERRYSLGAMGHYEFGEHADVYTQLMFSDYESVAQVAPSGNFFSTNTINCDNPLLPVNNLGDIGCDAAAIANGDSVTMYIGRRNVEGGGRQQSFANSSFRMVSGVRGAINDAWGYDVSAQYSNTTADISTLNYFVINRLQRALDVIDVGGVPTCRSVVDGTDLNCVPWNPFAPNSVTPDQLNYLQAKGLQVGRLNQEIYNGVINGDLGAYGVRTPWASDGVQVVFGAEYRRDEVDNKVDALQEAGQLAGSGGATIGISGSTKVEELFMEARVPLAQDQIGMESLSFDTAYRYSDYGDGVQTDTYKAGLEWAPDRGRPLAWQLSARRPCRQHHRAVLFPVLQPVRRAGRSLRHRGTGSECERGGMHRIRRPGCVLRRRQRHGPAWRPGQPRRPVLLPSERQCGADARRVGHGVIRYRAAATVRAGTRDHCRLLRHTDRQHDLDIRISEYLERLLWQQRCGGLRSHQPPAERLALGRHGARARGRYQRQHRLPVDEWLRRQHWLHRR